MSDTVLEVARALSDLNQTLKLTLTPSHLDNYIKVGGYLFSFLTACTSIFAIWIGIKSISQQEKTESLTRNLQVILECQEKYRSVEAPRLARKFPKNGDHVADLSKLEIESFFRNYWSVKSDQFDFWLSGYVDYDTFLTWNTSTVRHFIEHPYVKFFGVDFFEGWVCYGRPYHVALNPLFVGFTDFLEIEFRREVQWNREGRRITFDKIEKIIDVIKLFDELNRVRSFFGFQNKFIGQRIRRYGSPENLTQFKIDISLAHGEIANLFNKRYGNSNGKPYDIFEYGENLKNNVYESEYII